MGKFFVKGADLSLAQRSVRPQLGCGKIAFSSLRRPMTRVEGELRVKAAALGVVDTLDRLGLAGKKAGDDVAAGANKATAALDETASSADRAASSAENLGESSRSTAEDLYSVADAATAAGDAAFGASKQLADAATMNGKLDRVTFNLLQEQTARYNAELEALNKSNAAMDERAQIVNSVAASYNLLSAAQVQSLANARLENQQLQDRARQKDQERIQREQSTTTTSGGGGAPREIVVKVQGSANDLRSTAADREALGKLVRVLVPEIEDLARRGGTKIVVKG